MLSICWCALASRTPFLFGKLLKNFGLAIKAPLDVVLHIHVCVADLRFFALLFLHMLRNRRLPVHDFVQALILYFGFKPIRLSLLNRSDLLLFMLQILSASLFLMILTDVIILETTIFVTVPDLHLYFTVFRQDFKYYGVPCIVLRVSSDVMMGLDTKHFSKYVAVLFGSEDCLLVISLYYNGILTEDRISH